MDFSLIDDDKFNISSKAGFARNPPEADKPKRQGIQDSEFSSQKENQKFREQWNWIKN